MSHNYYAIILEFNLLEIKLGFVGEASEHVRINSDSQLWKDMVPPGNAALPQPAYLYLDSHSVSHDLKRDLLSNISNSADHKSSLSAYYRDKEASKWYDWEHDHYLSLSMIVKKLLSSQLLVSPLSTKLFVMSHEMSALGRSSFCKTFLSMKAAVSVTFLPFSPCCCMGAGVENGLVISLDWDACRITPVVDLRALPGKEFTEFSGESFHYSPLIDHETKTFSDVEKEILEDSTVAESILFSEVSLPELVARLVNSLSLDSRVGVASNVIFTGLRSDLPGLKGRILTEIASHLPRYDISGKMSLGAWSGASIYCSTTLLKLSSSDWKHMEISKINFEKTATAALEACLS